MQFTTTTLNVAGFKAKIMEAERLVGDVEFDLPPGKPLEAVKVSQFIKKPDHWLDLPGCYVVKVKPNKGLWFDWRGNETPNTAIMPSVKGCNPITGLQTSGFTLEQYSTKCPIHTDLELTSNRFCEKCGYSHPPQNYVASPNELWWDGFRNEDGTVRQFFFTEDSMRDIPSHLIGEENTVPAFGFAFYSKKPEFKKPILKARSGGSLFGGYIGNNNTGTFNKHLGETGGWTTGTTGYFPPLSCVTYSTSSSSNEKLGVATNFTSEFGFQDSNLMNTRRSIDVSVGAGAKIKQGLEKDCSPISEYSDSPDAVMRIYFVFEEEFNLWKRHGLKSLEDVEDGMLRGIPVG